MDESEDDPMTLIFYWIISGIPDEPPIYVVKPCYARNSRQILLSLTSRFTAFSRCLLACPKRIDGVLLLDSD